MIITKAHLNPFGAVADREFTFQEGLNVLLGPNEAGKSTLVNAIYAALFVPSNVRRNAEDWTMFLKHYLPHPDGDTARVNLEFISPAGQAVSYSCAWGSAKSERLVLGNGGEINDPDSIRDRLNRFLRFGKGTYREVLFARQEEMNRTFARLKEDHDAAESVSGLLRRSVFEAGGVSLEKLEAKIVSEYNRLLDNWDLESDGPRAGKGIDNRHKTKIGLVLEAYYRAEEIKRNIRKIRADEEEAALLAGRLEQIDREEEAVACDLNEYEKLEDDIYKRARIEPGLELLKSEDEKMLAVIKRWPVVQSEAEKLTAEINDLTSAAGRLEAELKEAEAAAKEKEKRELLKRIKPLKEDLEQKKEQLQNLPAITGKDLAFLEKQLNREAELKAAAGAMKLKAVIKTGQKLNLQVTSGFEQARDFAVEKEEVLLGEGRIILEAEGWSIDIQAGEEDIESLIGEAAECRENFMSKLAEFGLSGIAEAREAAAARAKAAADLSSAQTRLEDQLGGRNYSELEASVAELGEDKNLRDPKLISEEVQNTRLELVKKESQLEQLEKELAAWQKDYESLDNLAGSMADVKQQLKDKERQLAGLARLPEQFKDNEEFISELKKLRSRSSELKEQRLETREKLYELQKNMPEESTEELEVELSTAEEKLSRLKREGKAIYSVKKEFENLKKELDTDTYSPLQDRFARYLNLATNKRYEQAELEGVSPNAITSAEGQTLPVELLSAGTLSGAALALRLALAAYLLEDAAGFLIMDDPLVHLDPDRRLAAAELIGEFASDKQTIISTCDPQTADLLGGHVIEV